MQPQNSDRNFSIVLEENASQSGVIGESSVNLELNSSQHSLLWRQQNHFKDQNQQSEKEKLNSQEYSFDSQVHCLKSEMLNLTEFSFDSQFHYSKNTNNKNDSILRKSKSQWRSEKSQNLYHTKEHIYKEGSSNFPAHCTNLKKEPSSDKVLKEDTIIKSYNSQILFDDINKFHQSDETNLLDLSNSKSHVDFSILEDKGEKQDYMSSKENGSVSVTEVLNLTESESHLKSNVCHYFQIGQCQKGKSCLYRHFERPYGACLDINCKICNAKFLSKFCKSQEINERIKKVNEVLDKHKKEVNGYKNNALLDIEKEAQETFIFKINQLVSQRQTFVNYINFLLKKSIENINNPESLSRSLKTIDVEILLFRKGLPAYSICKVVGDELYKSEKRFCLIVGEPGSGKSTQVPQYLYQRIKFSKSKIICTVQSDKAVTRLAKKVAEELGVNLGDEVGYQLGNGKPYVKTSKGVFNFYSNKTKILFMPEELLLKKIINECKADTRHDFENVAAIFLDEIDERSLFSDVIFGILKTTFLDLYPRIKIFLASATTNVEKFRVHFENCQIIPISGRKFPVQIIYKPTFENDSINGTIEVLKEVINKRIKGELCFEGHILVFLPGIDEMKEVEELINKFDNEFNSNYAVHLLHTGIIIEEQEAIFDLTKKRRSSFLLNLPRAPRSLMVLKLLLIQDLQKILIMILRKELRS